MGKKRQMYTGQTAASASLEWDFVNKTASSATKAKNDILHFV